MIFQTVFPVVSQFSPVPNTFEPVKCYNFFCMSFEIFNFSYNSMATYGKIDSFNPSQESQTLYAEHLSHYFDANDITTESKKSILLTVCELLMYELIKSLLPPIAISNKTYKQIIKVLRTHYSLKPSPIIQQYKFHTRECRSGESIAPMQLN